MHGIMFHHFHLEDSMSRPGSFSSTDFSRALDLLEQDFEIVSPQAFFWGREQKVLPEKQVLLTFDDSLRSQFDVAVPVLEERGLSGAFAVYTSIYTGAPDPLEIFATFRAQAFPDFHRFWQAFLAVDYLDVPSVLEKAHAAVAAGFLGAFPFYSEEEKLFRFVRDHLLSREEYQTVMWSMISQHPSFDPETVASELWMSVDQLQVLVDAGHSVGLHSHTHPTRMDLLNRDAQQREYSENYNWILGSLGVKPEFAAHPCGRYNSETLEVISALGVKFGFCSTMEREDQQRDLEIPRRDSAGLLASV